MREISYVENKIKTKTKKFRAIGKEKKAKENECKGGR